jgi:tRNA-Thr(GGU) m(6)t(6)A37 methyltransferase TsaA
LTARPLDGDGQPLVRIAPMLRRGRQEAMVARTFTFRSIGIVRSPFREHAGTPIQPTAANGVEGSVELDASYADALAGLEGFERVWIVYVFDRAGAFHSSVVPYRDDRPHGLFATRAPARPNAIGLSALRLLSIHGATLRVADVDILDGTPVLDVKPYVPAFDAFPSVRAGWLDERRVPAQTADRRFEGGGELRGRRRRGPAGGHRVGPRGRADKG